jgi:hypothetical protein
MTSTSIQQPLSESLLLCCLYSLSFSLAYVYKWMIVCVCFVFTLFSLLIFLVLSQHCPVGLFEEGTGCLIGATPCSSEQTGLQKTYI